MTVSPAHRVSFFDSDSIGSIAYSADSKEIFVALSTEAVNVWRLIVYHWPYTLGLLAVIVVIFSLIALRHVLRHPRRTGRVYCRRCNYEISEAQSRCSECGRSLGSRRRVIRGRSFSQRLALPFGATLIALGGYAVLWIIPARYPLSAKGWFWWPSTTLLDLAQSNRWGFIAWAAQPIRTRVVVVDVKSGQRIRDLGEFVGGYSCYDDMNIAVSPDGKYLYIPDRTTDLIAIDTSSGQIRHRLRFDGVSRINQICGMTPDGAAIYAAFHDHGANHVSLIRWDVDAGRHTIVKSVEGDVVIHPAAHEVMRCPPRFYHAPNLPESTFLLIPSQRELLTSSEQTIRWFPESSPDAVEAVTVSIDSESDPMPIWGSTKMLFEDGAIGLATLDIPTGAYRRFSEPFSSDLHPRFHESGAHRLVFGGDPDSTKLITAYDLHTDALIPDTVMPALEIATSDIRVDLTPSPDRTSLAIEAFHNGGKGKYIFELLIYDLTPYPKLRELEFGEAKK